ncbi:MAG: hypothetical protein ABIH46_04285, partial [Chloroflexota bacterium]
MDTDEMDRRRREWEESVLKPALERFGLKESPSKFYTPADVGDFDFMEKVGFPGQYPFTAGTFPAKVYEYGTASGYEVSGLDGAAARRAGQYSGYGLAED